MSQIKLAAMLVMPLAFSFTFAGAQEQHQDCAGSSATASQPNSPTAPKTQDVYGPYVPYSGQPSKAQSGCGSFTAGNTPNGQTTTSTVEQSSSTAKPQPQSQPNEVYGAYVPYVTPTKNVPPAPSESAEVKKVAPAPSESVTAKKTPSAPSEKAQAKNVASESETAKVLSAGCGPVEYKVDEVYGRYVPYTGPKACYTPSEQQIAHNSPPPPSLNASVRQGHASEVVAKSLVSSDLTPIQPIRSEVAIAIAPEPPAGDPSGAGFIRTIPVPVVPPAPKVIPPDRPFRNLIVGFKGNTLGAGVEIATPVSRTLYLRSSFNMLAFDYPFNIHGVNYDARLHFKSSGTTLDWYPKSHRGFRVSPGILYVKNTLDAPANVAPGQVFKLSTQSFINSVDDPVSGHASVVYPHTIAPMILFGFRNTIPHTGGHLSVPIEFGAAYTGAPKISMVLDGTACTTMGCVSFDTNADAQKFLKQEIQNLNGDLGYFPFYPILSLGFAYHY